MITEMKTFRSMLLFAFALFFAALACANVTSFASPKYLSEHSYPVDLEDLVKNHRLITKNNDMLRQ